MSAWERPADMWIEEHELRWQRPLFDEGRTEKTTLPVSVSEQHELLEAFWRIGAASLPFLQQGVARGEGLLARLQDIASGLSPLVSPDCCPPESVVEQVARFARRWGPLQLCEHGTSLGHCVRRPALAGLWHGREPVTGWCLRSAEALLIGRIAAALRTGDPPSRADLEVLTSLDDARSPQRQSSPTARFHRDHGDPRAVIVLLMNQWLDHGDVTIRMQWSPRGSRLHLQTAGIYGVIGFALATAISGSQGIWMCDSCGRPYFRQRARKRGQGAYCDAPECKRATWRAAQQRRQAKKARERSSNPRSSKQTDGGRV